MRSCHHAREEDEGIVSMEEMSLLQKERKSLEGEQHVETVKVKYNQNKRSNFRKKQNEKRRETAKEIPVLLAHRHACGAIIVLRRIAFGQRIGGAGLLRDGGRHNAVSGGCAYLGCLQGAQLPAATSCCFVATDA